MVNEKRLIYPHEDLVTWFPRCNFRNVFKFESTENGIFVCDPTYISDVYNDNDPVSIYLRQHGSFLMSFGGDVDCPIWWSFPYVLLPISLQLEEKFIPSDSAELWVPSIGCDSGSFMFLPVPDTLPNELETSIQALVQEQNAFVLPAPAGKWSLFYEQFEPEQQGENWESLYRNIVLRYEGKG